MKFKDVVVAVVILLGNYYTAVAIAPKNKKVAISIIKPVVYDSLKTSNIIGLVYDKSGKPLGYSSIQLLNARDSSVLKNTMSDSTGRFVFKRIIVGNYLIRTFQMGYTSSYSEIFKLTAAGVTLAPIFMLAETNQLKEVSIVNRKPPVEHKIDRTILNVENSILANGGSINDLLEIAPGVSINNDQITMKGKEGVIVMIDGKQIKLSSSQISSLLQSMPANSISTIELITNPSAKYDAEGKGGIINIKTKRNTNLGFNGSITSGFTIGVRPRFNESLMLNYKSEKLNVFSNYSFLHNKQESEYFSDKIITDQEKRKYNQEETAHNISVSHNAQLGAVYLLNDKNSVGLLGSLNTNANNSDFVQHTFFRNFITNKIDSSLSSSNNGNAKFHTYSLNVNSRHILGTEDHVLSFDANYTSYRSSNPNKYVNDYFNENGANKRLQEIILNRSAANINVLTAKIDYTKPLNKFTKIEIGAKMAYTHSNSNIFFQNQDRNGVLVTDINRTNTFDYKEKINAAYVNFMTKLGKSTDLQIGFRGENTNYNGHSLTTGEQFKRSYFQLFPSLFLLHNLGKNQVSFSYSRRISRPDFEDLNPFIDYSSPYFYTQGNPWLQPETTHSFELNYILHHGLNISLGYSMTKNYFNYFTALADSTGKTKQTIENFKNFNTLALSISYTKEVLSFWNLTANADLLYNQYKTPLLGTFINIKQLAYNLNLLNSIELNKSLSLELLGVFKSKQVVLTRKIDSKYRVDAGIKYTVLQRNGTIKFGITDIFYTYINQGLNESPGLYSTFYNKNENRRFNLSFTYKFGDKFTTPKKEQSNQEEMNRLK